MEPPLSRPEASLATAALFLTIVGALFVLVRLAIFRIAGRTGQTRTATIRNAMLGGLVLMTWLAVTGIAATRGMLSDFSTIPPRIVFVLLPAVIGVLAVAYRVSPATLAALGPRVPIAVQAYRVAVEIFLYMAHRDGAVAELLTFEGRNFDIVTGITAIPVALACGKAVTSDWRKKLAIVWNVMGLVLLANVVGHALLSAPTPLQVFHVEPATTLPAQFPFVWLPGFIVPFALLLHLLSIRQWAGRWKIALPRIREVKPLDGYRVELLFATGERRVADLAPFLDGPVFEPLKDARRFRSVRVDPALGTIVWDNGADLDPDVLLEASRPLEQ